MMPFSSQGRDDLCLAAARGTKIRFVDGRELLCGTSGLWNVNLGYGNEAIAEATAKALRDASYLGVWGYENVYARRAAEALAAMVGLGERSRVLFSTSGGAANDMAMKIARHYHAMRGEGRRVILGLREGFHGMTFGAFALTDANLGQEMYGVDRRLVGHVPANDVDALRKIISHLGDQLAAIVVEPVIGNGAVTLNSDYVAELLSERERTGFLLVADEVSTGFGRVGPTMFATQAWPAPPDLVITAKALTNGTQASAAVVVAARVADKFRNENTILGHAETQAGTAVASAAILATIDETKRLDAVASGARLSAQLDALLGRMPGTVPLVTGTAGQGCLRAISLADQNAPLSRQEIPLVIEEIRRAGATVHPGPGCVQLLPALIYDRADLDELLARVGEGIAAYARSRRASLSQRKPG